MTEPEDGDMDFVEQSIKLRIGHALSKALVDPFIYVVRLKTGETIQFQSAVYKDGSDFISLCGIDKHNIADHLDDKTHKNLYTFDRDIDVRLDNIAWVSDAGGYDS